jgi:SPP1 gp7 family putative phage head morphogenesis protein
MRLSTPKLHKLRRKLNTFLYGFGFNMALDDAEKSKTYKQFILNLKKALVWQVGQIVKDENFERLVQVSGVKKFKVPESENKELAAVLRAIFEDLSLGMAFSEFDKDGLGVYLEWGANQGGQAAMDKLGIEGIFGVADPAWLKYLDNVENLLITSVDDTTKRWIAGILQEGIENQLTTLELRDLLITEAKDISPVRAEMIARTEIANVMNKTELESYRRAGIENHRWRTSRDERVCEICAPLDNEVVKVGRNFSVGVDSPPAHVQCRCFLQAVEDEWWQVGEKRIWMGD